ncbi:MAG: hypothetical protein Q8O85_09620 [Rhodoferax sp.]|uniref:hypothetical protein n=1 Tax=Rhodoferax sp. TaxID=50421 RepID=UPI0008D0A2EF|nr:hypothetical protein [Rhodoferax sp.]MDP2678967.1 hypothetical protein [Rhodoferax sp.]OGB55023.1 MAG: hypothetical protein A2503_16010 [Burkholderiales bacterium RIFOXYD12_FULL_59_19]
MNKNLFAGAFLLGAIVVVWVGAGFVGAPGLALGMTAVIAAVYGVGALELRQFRQASATLATALDTVPEPLPDLADWLDGVHPALQNPVRLRIEGERVGLPGPALTPYLVGLLVMLGMLGTFLGMVVTLNGAAFSLEGSTDLQAIRAALAAPIKGLGLAFGTSVAGVATSAMLGLMSVLSRRERGQAAQRLDTKIATTLRGFSLAHQRREAYRALQFQALALPEVVGQLQVLMVQMERMSQQVNDRLLSNQDSFHSEVKGVYTDLATSIDQSLKTSLAQSARLVGESIKPVVEATMAGVAQEARALHQRVTDAAQQQLDGLSERLGAQALAQQQQVCSTLAQTAQEINEQAQANASRTLAELTRLMDAAAEAPRVAAEVIGQLRQQLSNSLARDNELLQERSHIMTALNALLATINQSSQEQRAVIDALVASSAAALNQAGSQFAGQISQETNKLAGMADHVSHCAAEVSSSALEVSSLSDAFGFAVQSFNEANDKLIGNLQRIEAAMDKSMARSDDQLAYYVAQAREIIDLSLMSQKEIFEALRQLPARQARLAEEVS